MAEFSRRVFTAAETDVDELRDLVEKKNVSLRMVNGAGQTLAHIAAKANNVDVLRYVIEKNPGLLFKRDGFNCTLLHVATVKGAFKTVKYLVEERKADIRFLGGRYHDRTAMHAACEFNHLNIVKYFVEDRNIDINTPNPRQTQPPLFMTVKQRNWDIIKYLVEEKHADVKLLNANDESILFPTVRENALDIMKYFLDEKKFYFNVDAKSHYGETLVHVAAILGRIEILAYLVNVKKANVNQQKRSDKRTPLHYAAYKNDFEVCRFLIEHGADARITDLYGQTPADKATKGSVIDFLEDAANARSRRSVISPYASSVQSVPAPPFHNTHQRRIGHSRSLEGFLRESGVNVSYVQSFLFLANSLVKIVRNGRVFENPISFPSPTSVVQSRISPIAVDVIDADTGSWNF